MSLLTKILNKTHEKRASYSPPPEPEVVDKIEKAIKSRKTNKPVPYYKCKPRVDTSPPAYDPQHQYRYKMGTWARARRTLDTDNVQLVMAIKRVHFTRGRVDSRWQRPPLPILKGYSIRVGNLKKITQENKLIYKRLSTQGPKVVPTDCLMRDWKYNRQLMIQGAEKPFVLFPPVPRDLIEDPAFLKPEGVKRPRVYLTLVFEGGATLGELQVELFTDVCPLTCALFAELLAGDGVGFSYVGTRFFRKVPHLYWSGGDVVYDNGFGCYAQRGRYRPIGAENYHFSHSMPGLLSMSVTRDNEICGMFNITFKPLPQLDLLNVVFGRVVRPSHVFEGMTGIGKLLSSQPAVVLASSRQKVRGRWVSGTPNVRVERDGPKISRGF